MWAAMWLGPAVGELGPSRQWLSSRVALHTGDGCGAGGRPGVEMGGQAFKSLRAPAHNLGSVSPDLSL